MTKLSTRVSETTKRVALAAAMSSMMVFLISGSATAQTPPEAPAADPNSGALTSVGGLDVPSVYVFRGLVQESNPKFTLFPYGDVGLSLYSGERGIKSVSVNVGIWNSLQTGSSGIEGPTDKLHYEEDFYATLGLGLGRGFTLGTTYTAYTSPNGTFGTVHEIAFKVAKAHMLAPYGVVAFELKGQADSGSNEGTYLELGVGPSWPLAGGKVTVAVPVKLGLSLNDYYEGPDGDEKFGFLDVGALLTVPITSSTSRFGAWNIHGGVDVFTFGDTPKAFNSGDRNKVVGLFGIGLTY